MSDPKLPIYSKFCKCSRCGEYFTNEGTFTLHQRISPTGSFCVDPRAVVTKTGKPRLIRNAKGYWAYAGFHPTFADLGA